MFYVLVGRPFDQQVWEVLLDLLIQPIESWKGAYMYRTRGERNIEPSKVRDRESQFGPVRQFPYFLPACFLPLPKHHPLPAVSSLAFSDISFQHICLISSWSSERYFQLRYSRLRSGTLGVRLTLHTLYVVWVSLLTRSIRDLKIWGRRRW